MKDHHDNKTLELPGMSPEQPTPNVKRGRPASYHSAAERQKAYRERLKAKGMRTISRVVRDVRDESVPLVSDIIDLSEVRR
jgi:hypothetical protein